MKFVKTPIAGAYLIELTKLEDQRGFFARLFCEEEYGKMGLETKIVQINNSGSKSKGTMRGFHYQISPKEETKIVKCVKGSIWDVILDLRRDSPTFGNSYGAVLSDKNGKMMYIPKGFGHANLSLEDNTELIYLSTEFYSPKHERIILWNDPKFGVEWPFSPEIISQKDMEAPTFDEVYHLNSEG